jgi:hypothetical protein
MPVLPSGPVKDWPGERLIRSGLSTLIPPLAVLVLALLYWSGSPLLADLWRPIAGTVVDWVLSAVLVVACPLHTWYCGRVLLYRQERRLWGWILFFTAPLLMIAILLTRPPTG